MSVALAIVVGFLAARFVAGAARDTLHAPALRRHNHRGVELPTAGGLLAVVAVVVIEALRLIVGAFGVGARPDESAPRAVILFAVVGFGLLGLVDDLLGEGEHGGVRGHVVRAWRSRRFTTGVVKLLGGGALAVVLVAPRDAHSGVRLLVDASVVALAANLANLLDRAPGRTVKASTAAAIPLLVVAVAAGRASDVRSAGIALAVVVGAFAGLARDDLHEHLMLGDTGANALGAAVGAGTVLITSPATRVIVLVALAVLTLVSERVSFSAVIDRVPVLRAVDRWGAPHRE